MLCWFLQLTPLVIFALHISPPPPPPSPPTPPPPPLFPLPPSPSRILLLL